MDPDNRSGEIRAQRLSGVVRDLSFVMLKVRCGLDRAKILNLLKTFSANKLLVICELFVRVI